MSLCEPEAELETIAVFQEELVEYRNGNRPKWTGDIILCALRVAIADPNFEFDSERPGLRNRWKMWAFPILYSNTLEPQKWA